jgi:adenine C2-methylase RlmN of 23S rRNA A2503 and tRNA A37
MQKFSIHDEKKLKELLESNGIKAFRYSQIENAIYKNFVTDFDSMETIPKDVRKLLSENCFFYSLEVDTEKTSEN